MVVLPKISKEELLESIFNGYKDFIHFCQKEELFIGETSLLRTSIKTLDKISEMNS